MDKLKMHSVDLSKKNIEKIKALFPNCVTEAQKNDGSIRLVVDFDQLKQELSDSLVEGPQERYHLNWPGKRESILTANAPIAKCLRPLIADSVNFEETRNLFIQGDNLDSLKLLQESYLNKVQVIYIDPPYNTGTDFIYKDDFSENAQEYLTKSNQIDESGSRLIANLNSSGRFHSSWLSMIYPRIKLARNLLTESGVLFVSIDENESENLKKICSEVFGDSNFIGNIIWQSRTSISNDQLVSQNHNHTLIFAKNIDSVQFYGEPLDKDEYTNPDNDKRGPWKLVPIDANKPGGDTHYPITNPKTSEIFYPPNGRSWAINQDSYTKLLADGRIKFGMSDDSAPKRKLYLYERIEKGDTKTPSSILLDAGTTKTGTTELMELFEGNKVFDYPKPTTFIKRLLQYSLNPTKNQTVLDFFAGSGTTASAVLQLNKENNTEHNYILVQIPESIELALETAQGSTKKTLENAKNFLQSINKPLVLTEIAKYRIREIEKLNSTNSGFRVLSVDSSNMTDVYYSPDKFSQANLSLFVENVKNDRSSEDLLFQVLLDWGVELSSPIRKSTVNNKEVYFVSENSLVACFDKHLTIELIKAIASLQPLRAVFRDEGFSDDATKINAEQIFRQLAPHSELKTI